MEKSAISQLNSTSPAIDAGLNADIPSFLLADVAGNSRIVDYPGAHDPGAIVDMGAYEEQIPTVIAGALVTPAAQQFTFQFSQNVSASLAAGDLTLTSLAGGPAPTPATIAYNASTNTATISLSAALPGGLYEIDLGAAGAHLAADYVFNVLFLPAGTSVALPGEQTYTVQQFYFDPSATLDIGRSALALSYMGSSPAATIGSLIASAYNDDAWNGPGITSSAVSFGAGVGYFDDGSSVTVRLTWDGDANLSGTIDSNDLSLIALGQATNGTRWQDGNFNYDAQINNDDTALLFLGTAVSNDQAINSAASLSGSLPASVHAESPVASILPASLFSSVQAVLDAGSVGSLIA